jgi:hypothetical protein
MNTKNANRRRFTQRNADKNQNEKRIVGGIDAAASKKAHPTPMKSQISVYLR